MLMNLLGCLIFGFAAAMVYTTTMTFALIADEWKKKYRNRLGALALVMGVVFGIYLYAKLSPTAHLFFPQGMSWLNNLGVFLGFAFSQAGTGKYFGLDEIEKKDPIKDNSKLPLTETS